MATPTRANDARRAALKPLLVVSNWRGAAAIARDWAFILGAAALCERQPHRISGGQAQRVLLAIAFLREPSVVIADEPSASLDGGSYAELTARLQELVGNGSALLMARHSTPCCPRRLPPSVKVPTAPLACVTMMFSSSVAWY